MIMVIVQNFIDSEDGRRQDSRCQTRVGTRRSVRPTTRVSLRLGNHPLHEPLVLCHPVRTHVNRWDKHMSVISILHRRMDGGRTRQLRDGDTVCVETYTSHGRVTGGAHDTMIDKRTRPGPPTGQSDAAA